MKTVGYIVVSPKGDPYRLARYPDDPRLLLLRSSGRKRYAHLFPTLDAARSARLRSVEYGREHGLNWGEFENYQIIRVAQ